MNLIPIVLTIIAIISGSILVEFEMGLLVGLIVGLVALQRETHLKLVSLQDETRRLSKTPTEAPGEEPVADSKANVQYPDKFEPQPSHTWAASIPAKPEYTQATSVPKSNYTWAASVPAQPDRALKVERPKRIENPAPPMKLLTFRPGY
jgi:hypothetical protein